MSVSVFADAAERAGFPLDDAQVGAVDALASDSNVYLWGPPGRGKSWLLATYFDAAPTHRKLRVHFHEFFRDLHLAIRRHGNDLPAALDDLVGDADVVCFDEFHVHDPADGIFIARWLPVLLDRGVRVIVTSNYAPHALLPNPLFHDDFLPTIDLIADAFAVTAVDGPVDYRSGRGHTKSSDEAGFAAGRWVVSASAAPHALRTPAAEEERTLTPAGRPIRARRAAGGELWIDFAALCEEATAPSDYRVLAQDFPHWVIAGIPPLNTVGREPMQRFANLVDVLHDRDIVTDFLASVPLDMLYDDARLLADTDRIRSRLGLLRRVVL
ncbi:cell division protein ZapE [Rhodococcus rhodnii]|uniref:ATPase n=1 Tax=Rhodococcus rhodnii LMG 5362 TaxID=1273125 RepID=R7WSK5_9NOCA|nr:cell division protein ZapE [Rhodococcus rhodnii]EOM76964.1 ATPase [Rhodococcus rhodnii LMG 5362]